MMAHGGSGAVIFNGGRQRNFLTTCFSSYVIVHFQSSLRLVTSKHTIFSTFAFFLFYSFLCEFIRQIIYWTVR